MFIIGEMLICITSAHSNEKVVYVAMNTKLFYHRIVYKTYNPVMAILQFNIIFKLLGLTNILFVCDE